MSWLTKFFTRKPAPSAPPAEDAAPGAGCAEHDKTINLRQGSPEFDLFIAEATLEQEGQDLRHGAHHLACLLQVDPARPDWRALIARYIAAAGADVDGLLPKAEKLYAATEALRAYLWQAQGRTEEAVAHLVDVSEALGDARYLHAWALDWLEPEGAVEALSERVGMAVLAVILKQSEEAHLASTRKLRLHRRWAALAQRAVPRYAADGTKTMMRAGLLRKAGLFDEALAVAGPLDHARSFAEAAAIGLVLRRQGRFAESAQAFAKSIELEPGKIAGYLEAGDTWFEGGNWQNALEWYEGAVRLEPGQNWAEPSGWYCQWRLTGDEAWLERLFEAAKAGNRRANQLWFLARGAVPESSDATANIVRQIHDAWGKSPPKTENAGGSIKITLSTLEAPSNRLAVALEVASFRQNARLEVTVQSLPAQDPRLPVAEIDYLLWRYEGTDAVPALPPPPAEVADRIAALAAAPYDPETNWAQASHVAEALGREAVEPILAVMVHPPPMPAGTDALAWLARLQLAAAQVLAWIDEGWEGSARRRALLSLLYGPFDWTTAVAIRVLARLAREEQAYALKIHECFEQLERSVPKQGHWDWVAVLYREWRTLPFLFDQEREELKRKEEAIAGD